MPSGRLVIHLGRADGRPVRSGGAIQFAEETVAGAMKRVANSRPPSGRRRTLKQGCR